MATSGIRIRVALTRDRRSGRPWNGRVLLRSHMRPDSRHMVSLCSSSGKVLSTISPSTYYRSRSSTLVRRYSSIETAVFVLIFIFYAYKLKRPDLVSPDRALNDYYSAPNGLRDLSSPRPAHDRFHLIFQTEFHLLETMLLHLLLHRQMWKSLQFVQLPGVIGVFGS